MPAAPLTNNFMLSQGTLMLAPFAQGSSNLAFDLDPATHSVGLIKGVTTSEESSQIELRSGVRQLLVDSQKSGVKVTVGAEVFEYTSKNLLYSLSLNRTTSVVKANPLAAPAATAAATLNVGATALSTSYTAMAVGDIPAGTFIMVQGSGDKLDRVFVTKVQTTPTVMTSVAISPAVPAGMTGGFATGDGVYMINQVPIGTTAAQDFFSLKIVGTLANENKPVAIVFPKVKISKGFNLDFSEDKYGSMQWEIEPYFLTTADIGGDARLALVGTSQLGIDLNGF